jgi:hypothetical protein
MYRLLMTGHRSNQHRRVFHAISDQDRAYSAARVDRDRKSPCSICARSRPPPPGRRSQRPVRSVGKSKPWTGSRRLSLLGVSHSPAPCREETLGPSSEASLALVRIVPMSPWLRFVSFSKAWCRSREWSAIVAENFLRSAFPSASRSSAVRRESRDLSSPCRALPHTHADLVCYRMGRFASRPGCNR